MPVVSVFVGAAIAFVTAWLTNKANRDHDLEKQNREHAYALKRDVLLKVTQCLVQTHATLKDWENAKGYVEYLDANGEAGKDEIKHLEEEVQKSWNEHWSMKLELDQAIASACLAVSDDLWKSAQQIERSIVQARNCIRNDTLSGKTTEQVGDEILAFTKQARMELGIVRS